jgi:hypothetical protein
MGGPLGEEVFHGPNDRFASGGSLGALSVADGYFEALLCSDPNHNVFVWDYWCFSLV